MPKGLLRNWEALLFVAALCMLAYGWGVATLRFKIWPYQPLNQAFDAADDWPRNWKRNLELDAEFLAETTRAAGGVVVHDPALASPGLTLVSGFRDGEFQLWLMDMAGTGLHRWKVDLQAAFPTVPEHLDALPRVAHFHGVVLSPEGHATMNVVGAGTVQIDRCSKVRWVHADFTHHSIDLLPDGSMLIPIDQRETQRRKEQPWLSPGPQGYYSDEGIAHIGADGTVLRQARLTDLVHAANQPGLILGHGSIEREFSAKDPYHLNDIELLRPELAAAFPMFEPGDLMLSLRNLAQIVVLDRQTWLPKWSLRGPFFSQHDPDFLPNGNILVYDNQYVGHDNPAGKSRIIEIDPKTQQIVWSYEDPSTFYAPVRGLQQALPNGNVLAVDPEEGRVFEIARGHGNQIVWEYINLLAPGQVGVVINAERFPVETFSFLGQPCP